MQDVTWTEVLVFTRCGTRIDAARRSRKPLHHSMQTSITTQKNPSRRVYTATYTCARVAEHEQTHKPPICPCISDRPRPPNPFTGNDECAVDYENKGRRFHLNTPDAPPRVVVEASRAEIPQSPSSKTRRVTATIIPPATFRRHSINGAV
jgi:hypothetical protein